MERLGTWMPRSTSDEGDRSLTQVERRFFSTASSSWMAKTMRAHDDLKRNSADMEAANHYVRTRLGRNGGDTFLTELSPIPSAKTADKVWMATIQRPRPENQRQNQAAKRGAKGNAGHKHSVFSRVLWQATKGICDTVWMLNGRSSSRVGVLPPNSRQAA